MKTYKTPKIKVIVIEDSLLHGGSQSEEPVLQNSSIHVNAEDARSKQFTGLFDDSDDENYAD